MILKKITIWAFLIGTPFFSLSQQIKVTGTVTDSLNNPIPAAIITISSTKDVSNILAYGNSNARGNYSLSLVEYKVDSIFLTVKHMAYLTNHIKIPLQNSIKDFKLLPKAEQLEEVLIQSQKIIKIRGDTITYNVEGLKAEKDYTIEDVISRIPGIEISENGRISYNEKAISHLYINGVDLLESRYNIASRGIPADAVKNIDILTKHNHERIDIGRTESDKVSLNLKIKENHSVVFGSVKIEAGLPFATGLAEATPIYLKNEFQNISSLKLNNSGETLKGTGDDLTLDEPNLLNVTTNKTTVIRLPSGTGIALSNRYWLDNESYALTNDALHKVDDSTLVKWNVNYIKELSKIQNSSIRTYLLGNDSIGVSTRSRNQLRSQQFKVGVNQEINQKNIYLKNKTSFQYSDSEGGEKISINENKIQTTYQNYNMRLANTTTLKTLIRKNNILHTGLIVEYDKLSENLIVTPPVYEQLLDETPFGSATDQIVKFSKLNIGSFAEYSFDLLRLNWKVHQSLQYNNFQLESQLTQLPELTNPPYPFSSDFGYQKIKSTSRVSSKWNLGQIRFVWSLSAEYISINTREQKSDILNQDNSLVLLQPLFSVKFKVNAKWDLGVSYNQNNSISDFNELYQPYILISYNSIVRNPEIVNKYRSQSLSSYLSYSNILKSFYFNIKGSINRSESDVTFSNQLNDEGFIVTDIIKRPNSLNSRDLSLNFSKGVLGSINSNFSYMLNFTDNELFFNNQFVDAVNRNHRFELGFSWDNGRWYSLEYKARFYQGASTIKVNKINNSSLFHTLNLDIYTSSSTRVHLGAESSRASTSLSKTTNTNTIFNLSFFYKPSKRLFVKTSLTNIFDTSSFLTTFSSLNSTTISQFSLRPRQLTFGLTYSL